MSTGRASIPDVAGRKITVRQPSRGWTSLGLGELSAYSQLLYYLILRDIKVRYKQSVLGASWAIIQPVLGMIVFSVFLGNLAGVPSDGVPYPVFVLTGLVAWTFFSTAFTQAAMSLVVNVNLLKKIYFPRLLLPLGSSLSGVIDLFFALVVLAAVMLYYDQIPGVRVVMFPVFLLLLIATALGAGLWLSAFNVRFRDVRQAIPFIAQFWLFSTPVAYPSSLLSEPWRTLFGLNPMTGVVEGFRWALLDVAPPPSSMLLVSALTTLVLLVSGAFVFRRMERDFADVV